MRNSKLKKSEVVYKDYYYLEGGDRSYWTADIWQVYKIEELMGTSDCSYKITEKSQRTTYEKDGTKITFDYLLDQSSVLRVPYIGRLKNLEVREYLNCLSAFMSSKDYEHLAVRQYAIPELDLLNEKCKFGFEKEKGSCSTYYIVTLERLKEALNPSSKKNSQNSNANNGFEEKENESNDEKGSERGSGHNENSKNGPIDASKTQALSNDETNENEDSNENGSIGSGHNGTNENENELLNQNKDEN